MVVLQCSCKEWNWDNKFILVPKGLHVLMTVGHCQHEVCLQRLFSNVINLQTSPSGTLHFNIHPTWECWQLNERQCGLEHMASDWESEELGSIPGSATDVGQVISPLCASVSPSVRIMMLTAFVNHVEISR